MPLHGVERRLPDLPVQLEPAGRGLEAGAVEAERVPTPANPARDDPRLLEHLEVLRDRRLRDGDASRRLADARRPPHEPLDNLPPDGVREREEAPVELRLIVHLKGRLSLDGR